MQLFKTRYQTFYVLAGILFLLSCNTAKKEDTVVDPKAMDKKVAENISAALKLVSDNSGKLDDSTSFKMGNTVTEFYRSTDYKPVWSSSEKWQPMADSLYNFIQHADLEGLFPEDYHARSLQVLKSRLDTDSLSRMDAGLWTKTELLLSDGFMRIVKDLKLGRLPKDSVSLNKDSVLKNGFYIDVLNELVEKKQFSALLNRLQPVHKGYWELKKGISGFIENMDRKVYAHINYPFKRGDKADSLYFIKLLQDRLFENKSIDFNDRPADSAQLAKAITKYQNRNGLKPDGKYGKILVSSLNSNDVERFKRIALTLDKYKQLPEKMPDTYIWVNIPGYYLWMINKDTVVFESKIICGKPETRTPLLNAEISDMITYPTWTVPNSIIVKQYLPKLKNNSDYFSKLGLQLKDSKGELVDPNTVNWNKYSRGIPYKVMQASGDNNSLGVIKFNFDNRYFVYLHDTNQRYLFKNSARALSHGCVRVQEWEKLAFYIANNDSSAAVKNESLKYTADSIRNWIAAKERHRIDVKNHIPLYIRYFTCEGINGKVKFYDDVYGEDKLLMEKYFSKK